MKVTKIFRINKKTYNKECLRAFLDEYDQNWLSKATSAYKRAFIYERISINLSEFTIKLAEIIRLGHSVLNLRSKMSQ